jgi:AcrR family transcriptional regulator
VHGASRGLIAAELDLRGPRLYHYFSSEEELSLSCVHKSAAEVCARLRAIAAAELADSIPLCCGVRCGGCRGPDRKDRK